MGCGSLIPKRLIGNGPQPRGELIMTPVHVNSVVRLKMDVPTLYLQCGAEGTVVSVWLAPGDFLYEVEFGRSAKSAAVRALLRAEQLEVVP